MASTSTPGQALLSMLGALAIIVIPVVATRVARARRRSESKEPD